MRDRVEGGGILQVPWWRKKASEDQMRFRLESVMTSARVWRKQESGRRDGSEGGSGGGGGTDSKE